MIRRSFLLLLASGTLLLSACGFQLRGEQNYAFKRLAIVGAPAPLAARLTRVIEGGSDTVVVNSAANADAVLTVSEGRSLATLTLNTFGVVEEYQVNYSLNYSLKSSDGTLLIAPSVIALNRALTYSTQFATAKISEADLLFADMQSDAADQLTRRLSLVHGLHPGKPLPAVAPGAPLPPPPL